MNYRHAYHAGNFADVLKHAVFSLVLDHMTSKEAAFRVIDSHAGIGLYDLGADEAQRTGEWQHGIARLAGPTAPALPTAIATLLTPYLSAVAAQNPEDRLERYPGSPLIATHLTRPQDRIVLSELHPADFELLAQAIGRTRQVKVHHMDGWTALKAFLPPLERRGVILIDPPYEQRDELQRMARGLAEAAKRFATGIYLLWYPIKDRRAVAEFHRTIAGGGFAQALHADLLIRDPLVPERLTGCGLVIVNPPWRLPEQLALLLPFLAERLALASGGGYELGWLAGPNG